MQITATMLVELDEGDRQEFEDAHWRYDAHYKGDPYFQDRESGPFLVDLERVSYETREWLEKYNGGWEGFAISFTAEERLQMEHLATYQDDLSLTLYPDRAIMYFHQSYLEWLVKEMARSATSPTLKKEG